MVRDELTCILFTSPIPSNPSDWILENVYLSIRNQLPDVRIVILADGVNDGEPQSYRIYKNKIRQRGWDVMEFGGYHHETLMLKHALSTGVIETPLVLVCEHDWGFQALSINWERITEALLDPAMPFSLIQIRQAEFARWEDGHFREYAQTHGITLRATNWFQTPSHIAHCDWYRKIVSGFTEPRNLECDQMNSALAVNGFKDMACYVPEGDIGRLYHLDGRYAVKPYLAPGMFIPKKES